MCAYPHIHRPYYYGGFSLSFGMKPDETVACGKLCGDLTQRAGYAPARATGITAVPSVQRPGGLPDVARRQRPVACHVIVDRQDVAMPTSLDG
jgi:hypothetical protein